MTINCLAVKGFLAEFSAFRSSMRFVTTLSRASYLSSHFQSKPGVPPLMEVDIFQPCVMKITRGSAVPSVLPIPAKQASREKVLIRTIVIVRPWLDNGDNYRPLAANT
jgi:hypothetical protein